MEIFKDNHASKIYGFHNGMTYLFIEKDKWKSQFHSPVKENLVKLSTITWGTLYEGFEAVLNLEK